MPFIEKPVDAENHNINVVLSQDSMRSLFRKVGNKSSELIEGSPISIRRDQDYVYEEFLKSDNSQDVKLYTVGPYYVYAECRKAPTKDGKVERNAEGKEVRYPTVVSEEEKEIARRVCMAFGQTVCGFDILRCNGRSYVIDVNGWSFVKGNEEYYDRCAMVLRDTFLRVSRRSLPRPTADTIVTKEEWRLISYIAVFRHADRTPKQKFKTLVSDPAARLLDPDVNLREVYGQANLREFMAQIKDVDIQLYSIMKKRCKVPGTKVQLHRKPDQRISVSVKWGGEFTHAGRHQAKDIGESIKSDLNLLLKSPNNHSCDDGPSCVDYNVLNTRNVRIHAGRERRVVATANVFAKSLLGISELPVDFVQVDLRPPSERDTLKAKEVIESIKEKLLFGKEDRLSELVCLLQEIDDSIQKGFQGSKNLPSFKWCCSDSPTLFKERWDRTCGEILKGQTSLDPSRIFDLYDSLKYDLIHHKDFITTISGPKLRDLVDSVQSLFNQLASRQYGESKDEQLLIGKLISGNILCSIMDEIEQQRLCSFYFTKESNLHCLHSLLKHSLGLEEISELDYLAQVEIEVWRRGEQRSVRAAVRQGAHLDCLSAGFSSKPDHALKVTQKRLCVDYMDYENAINRLQSVV